MQIIFKNEHEITCDCGWNHWSFSAMSEQQAQSIANMHILHEHTAEKHEGLVEMEFLEEVPEFQPVELESFDYDDITIRMEALRAATANTTETYTPRVAIGWAKQYEHYIRTGEAPSQ